MKRFAIALLLAGIPVVGWAGDYPIKTPAPSIHPKQQELEITQLSEAVRGGKKEFKVLDASGVDARQWLLVMSPDGVHQETHCIKSVDTEEREIKLSHDLEFDYPSGTRLLQGSIGRERGIVTRLSQEADDGDHTIWLESTRDIDPLEQIILQSPTGLIREAHCIRWIEGQKVRLYDKLHNDFSLSQDVEGEELFTTVIQGGLIDGVAETEQNPCCCPGKKAGRR